MGLGHGRAQGHGIVRGAVAVLVIMALQPLGALAAPPARTELDVLGVALLLAGSLALVALRWSPAAAVAGTTVGGFGYLLLGYPGTGAAVPVMISLFVAAKTGHRRIIPLPLAALALLVVSDLMLVKGGLPPRETVHDRFLLAGWLVASAALGGAFHQWGNYVQEAERRAAEAERTREETALRRAGEERLRIARELHDSLTHSISIIKVQAGVAVHLARKRGEQVPEALLAVQEASSEAMRELRATLEVLRDGDASGSGLDRLGELVQRARSAGLPATLTISGSERTVPAEVDQAAYRIVQEALTNVTRHAGPASAAVRIVYGTDALTVQVDDDGLGTGGLPESTGLGLLGMRERVAALGGRLRAEPRPEGGFTVRAELPVGGAS
ncbi:sensor histidine kinase [Thermomonospora umbrina]|uniref:histidine kinase n=1 Tax=Thermomonospora umbrina TaxID=111806 RepID=A0A3D9T4V2_9ACTN|nr:sensor histidine kinase [Thermomonospora umbrina]REE99724.1 signal transduction histidine kinase [Thermomonospora umbrina]